MKNWNKLNRRLFIVLCIVIFGVILEFFIYDPLNRYDSRAYVFTPEEFPICLYGLWFKPYFGTPSLNESEKSINRFNSYWGKQSWSDVVERGRLPEKLFLEYTDFRTKKYYCEEITIPKKAMKKAIQRVYENEREYMRYENVINILVGIANEGHIIFWIEGRDYQTEFFRTQIFPKPFPKKLVSVDFSISNKEDFIKMSFEEIPDSIQQQILNQNVENINYKDSIPRW